MEDTWQIKKNTSNYKPISDPEISKQMVAIRAALTTAANIFKSQVGNHFKKYFSYMEKSGHDRFWGNDNLTVTFTRDNNEYFVMVDGDDGTYFVFSFDKPVKWDAPVQLEAFAARGKAENIIKLATLFNKEWPTCHRLVWNETVDSWI